jgi:hypothetical protein
MFSLISKISIIVLATVLATSMPEYFSDNISGFVPTQETLSKNLHTDVASSSSQISAMDISGDVSSEDFGKEDDSIVAGEQDENKSQAYNTKSGKVIGEVSDKAIENDNPIVYCDDERADCETIPTPTNTPKPSVTPTPKITPTPTSKTTPTEFPKPTVTIIPLPSKYPTIYPCPPRPVDGIDVSIEVPPCADLYIY